jgi:hypothetical protein
LGKAICAGGRLTTYLVDNDEGRSSYEIGVEFRLVEEGAVAAMMMAAALASPIALNRPAFSKSISTAPHVLGATLSIPKIAVQVWL